MIDGLIDLILRDFVRSWYDRISSQPAFTIEVDRAIRAALANILERVLAVDLVELTTSRFVPIITQHLRDFYEAERVVKGKRLSRNVTESDELDLAIAGKYKDGNLHPAASLAFSNLKSIQQQHLRSIVMRLLPQILPKSMTSSPAVTVLIKEIVSCAVLYPITQMLSDPDTWNQLIENYVRNLTKPNRVSLAS
jgi:sorting nexin-25